MHILAHYGPVCAPPPTVATGLILLIITAVGAAIALILDVDTLADDGAAVTVGAALAERDVQRHRCGKSVVCDLKLWRCGRSAVGGGRSNAWIEEVVDVEVEV